MCIAKTAQAQRDAMDRKSPKKKRKRAETKDFHCPHVAEGTCSAGPWFEKVNLVTHMLRNHEWDKNGLCPQVAECGSDQTFEKFDVWRVHLRTDHPTGDGKGAIPEKNCLFRSTGCMETFTHISTYNRHINQCHGVTGALFDEEKLDIDGRKKSER
jgi:hypothetical protein